MRVSQTPEDQRFGLDACMAGKAGVWHKALRLSTLCTTLITEDTKCRPDDSLQYKHILMVVSLESHAAIHVFGGFHGRELVFEVVIHVFGGFHGREARITCCSGMEVCMRVS